MPNTARRDMPPTTFNNIIVISGISVSISRHPDNFQGVSSRRVRKGGVIFFALLLNDKRKLAFSCDS
jgi:hypothetical protein